MTDLCLLDMSGKQCLQLKSGKNWVGRDVACDICINDRLLSRKHAVIGVAQKGVVVCDLNSTNGTLENFKRIRGAHPLKIGDAVTFGELTYRLAITGMPLRETLLGRDRGRDSYSISDPGGESAALRESWPLPPGWGWRPGQTVPELAEFEGDAKLASIIDQVRAEVDETTRAVLAFPSRAGGQSRYLPLIGSGPWTLGREDTCDLVVNEETVSQRHARIKRDGGGWLIEDLGAKNGLKVDGVRVRKARLEDTSSVRLGMVSTVFVCLEASTLV